MDLDKIKEILNAGLPADVQRRFILKIIADDEEAIPTVLEILSYEREKRKKLVIDMNLELSRAHLTIEKPEINKDHFVEKQIIKFYHKNKDQIGHCFANMDKYPVEPDDEDKLGWT